jgi:hypothetical protein
MKRNPFTSNVPLPRRKPKMRPPAWLPALVLRVFDHKFLIHPGRRWDEVFVSRPGEKRVTLVRVLPAGRVDWDNATLRTEYLMGVFDRLPTGPNGADGGKLPEDPDFLEKWPGLWELLTETKYPDGSARERSSLFVVIEEGTFKVSINERTREMSCWGAGPTFERALDCLEGRVTSDSPEWRANRGGRRKKG